MPLKDIKKGCEAKGLRLTTSRQDVYEIIEKSDKPIGAYEILEKLSLIHSASKPPTVYRALDFLIKHNFIHRIESLNAYIVCEEDHAHHGSQFIVCDKCTRVEEIHLCHLPKEIDSRLSDTKFQMLYWNTEIHGLCQACQK